MPIEIDKESLLSLAQAAKTLPNRPHPSTLWRWVLRGVRGIKLESCLLGAVRYTSAEALQRFSDRLTAQANGESAPVRTTRQRQQAIDRADRELTAEGV